MRRVFVTSCGRRVVVHLTRHHCYSRPIAIYHVKRGLSSMAAAILKDNPILGAIDSIIDKVKHLSTNTAANTTSSSSSSSSSTSAGISSSDVAWRPVVPPGHTSYTWGLEDDDDMSASTKRTTDASSAASAPNPSAVSAPAPSSSAAIEKAANSSKAAKIKAKAKAETAPPPAAKVERTGPEISRIDIRVGQVVSARKHPDADALYIEEIDVGESSPRQVVSGLVAFISLEELSKARLCVIVNLKASALRGVTSYGMVLAASNADHTAVELITPPNEAKVGERVTLIDADCGDWVADAVVDPKAKKDNAWLNIKGELKTDESGVATWSGRPLGVNGRPCRSATLCNAAIS